MTKLLLSIVLTASLMSCASMKNSGEKISGEYEVACGMCQFDMTGDECDLAIKIDEKFYYVEGTTIHEHGDPDAEGGLCTAILKAQVTGEIKKGVFMAESFELLPASN